MAEEPFDYDVINNLGTPQQPYSPISLMNHALAFSKLFIVGVNALFFMIIVYFAKLQQNETNVERIIKKKENEQKRNIGLVIAHPDDEAMFFTPTILALLEQKDVIIHVLCLSTGNADGIGKQRTKELGKSCKVLGISTDDQLDEIATPKELESTEKIVVIVNSELLRDGMKEKWETTLVSEFVQTFVKRYSIESVRAITNL
jgi:hypothetical protein